MIEIKNMKGRTELFDFNDILLMPAKTSPINSRREISSRYGDMLPIITAPMDTVVGISNFKEFKKNNINICLPRGEKYRGIGPVFTSMSLFDVVPKMHELVPTGHYLIDVANGHMDSLVEKIKLIKEEYPEITLMVGNIANPLTYKVLSEAGADYIRVGIGNGNGCLTTQQTAVGYPMGSLINNCYKISETLDNPAKIVADGGMKSYSDIIKALALGADYVMVGSLLNKCIESTGDNYLFKHFKISSSLAKRLYGKKIFGRKINIYKKFRGMSTKEVQKKWGKNILKTSEGVTRIRKVEYTMESWCENFDDYLKSAMSYCGARNLSEFIGEAKYNLITQNAFDRFKK
jgi:IMP dehydrogenase/GMP reductase